jgi:TRAP-type C4-dicarboxylate transport system permease small subunit
MIKVGKIIDRITLVVSMISFSGVLAIMILNVADVLMTKLFAKPITGAYEITEILLLCTVMAAFAYGQSKKSHINMTLIIKVFPRPIRLFIFGLMGLVSTGTAAVVGYAAILQAESAISRGMSTSVLFIPMYPFFYIEAIAMFIFALALLYDAILAFAAIFNKKLEEIVTSTWA